MESISIFVYSSVRTAIVFARYAGSVGAVRGGGAAGDIGCSNASVCEGGVPASPLQRALAHMHAAQRVRRTCAALARARALSAPPARSAAPAAPACPLHPISADCGTPSFTSSTTLLTTTAASPAHRL